MSHLSDKDLDRLSREAAEQFDVEASTSGWEALEKKLDKDLPTTAAIRKRKWWRLLVFLLVFLLPVAIVVITFSGPKENTSKSRTGKRVDETSSALRNNSQRFDESPVKDRNTSDIGTARPEQKEVIPSDEHSSSAPSASTASSSLRSSSKVPSSTLSSQSSPSSSVDQPVSRSATARNRVDKYRSVQQVDRLQKKPIVTSISNIEDDKLINEDSEDTQLWGRMTVISEALSKRDDIALSTGMDSIFIAQPLATDITKKKQKGSIGPRLSIGIVAGSDFSNVRFKGGDRPGINAGITAGYRLGQRWQISTGLIYTHKYYFAKGQDYNPKYDYWTNYVELDYIDGDCSMWEIPLIVRYDLTSSQRGSWFAATGLSSYLMKKESYEYYYTQNGTYDSRYRSYPTNEKYLFSIAHLSGGYERRISKRLSLQVEPYIKLPLKGLGFGRMQLNSFGTNASLKFNVGN